jgi:hypothetical protein
LGEVEKDPFLGENNEDSNRSSNCFHSLINDKDLIMKENDIYHPKPNKR